MNDFEYHFIINWRDLYICKDIISTFKSSEGVVMQKKEIL